MEKELQRVKVGLVLVMVGLLFGIGMGIVFGVNEDLFKDYVAQGIAAHPDVHDAKSPEKIWRYAQRAHFHATGIAAFSLGLIVLVMFSSLKEGLKKVGAIFLGLGSWYPMAWFSMFYLAPSIGRTAAHAHPLTEFFAFVGVGGILLGTFFLCANLFLGFFAEEKRS
ncbi:MAG: hypothetical protein KC563_01265 [Nitrospira sp.]|nr:hypothetical protein [Nitrospira sp.]MCA9474431.1 hypothetical protein [Nitrospira sp.]MCA9480814.1 hypothetical protein [Nitrospira sp.]MCB9710742.1 hypothetical protein [Nitrospiraceae bacterium]MDR4487761.1 hypothetical protein [Nitrospirales bacterium]